ncbi:Nucleoside-diphosphate-sugar epimerase [Pricia antarctica]|uniref:Nucleoside-diphosphate-sugar epimerase n=1 Tax=Pricia antarctica TaxID=641691 RepID=A0A1G6YD37_9FLAO|nr:NAD-dependent epimerase/dehydratase family protein [Pricia antarctica]SDD87506.1 Nucleoside-diphosphate-sugar epimerase [Pricia antarctica]
MQTILGAGGAIGIELAKALKQYTTGIRLVSRNPKKVNKTDTLLSADLLQADDVKKAVQGSSVVYVTVGFPYNLKVWQSSWPKFMETVIAACKEENCKLVFFDNIYMYDRAYLDGMDEETPINPPSEKGKVRALIATMLLDEVKAGNITALIARSADFYGPNIANTSMLNETVIKNLAKGKKANWMGAADRKHSFTYTPDAGKATALLGNTSDAYNQVWHLPTASDPYTGKEWVEHIAKAFGAKPKMKVVPKWMIPLIGLFVPVMKEMPEMLYQYDRDYVFDSSKFEKRFGMAPTPYDEGIKEMIAADYP